MFITFEGTEGAGKTTQIALLERRLSECGRRVRTTRQPGGTPLGKALRGVVLDRSDVAIDPLAELLTMMADRAQSVSEVIRPALEHSEIVVCDRYGDSSLAYQGYGRGIALDLITQLNAVATGGLSPDLTVLLDIDAEIGLARQSERNRMESEDLGFHRRVRDGFLRIAEADPARFVVIDASAGVSEVASNVWEAYEAYHRHRA